MPTAIDREPSATAVQWNPKVPPTSSLTSPTPRAESKATTTPEAIRRTGQWTILARASSMMSVAPWSFRAGMSDVDLRLAAPPSRRRTRRRPNSSDTVGDRSDGQDLDDAGQLVGGDVELDQHLAPGLERALQQGQQLLHGVALVGVGGRRPGWR